MKIKDVFWIKTGQRIIEEDVYNHKGGFPCITSQTSNNGITWYADKTWLKEKHGDAIINEESCITWTKDGAKCGTMFYRNYPFYPNDHCGVLILREHFKEELNLKWFIYAYQDVIKNHVTQQGSQGMLYNSEMAEIEIEYPFPDRATVQDEIVKKCEKVKSIKECLIGKKKQLNELLEYELKIEDFAEYTVEQIALLNKGSNKISEEMIYRNYDKGGVPVYSSATENAGLMGRVSKECYSIFDKKGLENELTWTTNGYAGKVFFRQENYLYSEKCGRIVIRREYKDKINPKYLMYILNQITYKYKTSESNNGKLDIIHMSNIKVPIPVDDMGNIDIDRQNRIIDNYQKIERIVNKLDHIINSV